MTVYDGRKGSRPINFIVTQIVIMTTVDVTYLLLDTQCLLTKAPQKWTGQTISEYRE